MKNKFFLPLLLSSFLLSNNVFPQARRIKIDEISIKERKINSQVRRIVEYVKENATRIEQSGIRGSISYHAQFFIDGSTYRYVYIDRGYNGINNTGFANSLIGFEDELVLFIETPGQRERHFYRDINLNGSNYASIPSQIIDRNRSRYLEDQSKFESNLYFSHLRKTSRHMRNRR
jgi:hypothetical protein